MSSSHHDHPAAPPSVAAFRRATNLELFLDLVFVFAIAQLAILLAHDLTWAGAGRGGLMAWLVWWQWSQFAWAGSGVDFEAKAGARLTVMASIPIALAMAVAIPDAFHATGPLFGIAYALAQVAALAILGHGMWSTPARRDTFITYAMLASIGPLLVAVGGWLPEPWRTGLWIVAGLAGIVGALAGGARREGAEVHHWSIDPGHFSERHALFVIIVLGEVVVAAGANVGGALSTAATLAALGSAAFVACVIWWMYFAYVPKITEHALAHASPATRGNLARDLLTFAHFPLVFGVLALAVVVKHVVKDPGHALPLADRAMLAASIGATVGGFVAVHLRYNGGVAIERPITMVVLGPVVVLAGGMVPGAALLAVVGASYLAMHAVTMRLLEQRLAEGRARQAAHAR